MQAVANEKLFFGHPRGLMPLFFTEYWERFSFYGMRALLVIYMVASPESGGLGFDTVKAALIYGYYLGAVYIAGLPGGFIADRYWGQRKAVFVGGVIIIFGHAAMAFEGVAMFYLGLGLLVVGTGFLKPNISVMVGQLYKKGDARRDGGFIIFYMGINLGAFLAPLIIGYVGQQPGFIEFMNSMGIAITSGWHFAFAIAAVGMVFGLIQYQMSGKLLGNVGVEPKGKPDKATHHAEPFTADDKKRVWVVIILLIFVCVFFSAFEQAGSSLSLFALNNTNNTFLGFNFPSSWFQSQNAGFILIFGPIFAWLWVYLAKKGAEPSGTTKFMFGLLGVGLGFLVLYIAVALFPGEKVSPMWLTMVYLLHTLGELCLSPVGLSLMTKLAPKQIGGSIMGLWFVAVGAGGGFVGGLVASLYDANAGQEFLFGLLTVYCLAAAFILLLLIKPIKKMLEHSNYNEAEQSA